MEENDSVSESNTIKRQKEVIKTFQKMLQSGSSNDVTIVLSDGEIKANKDVLCASSDYFATMFGNEAFDECKNGVVPMKDVKKVVMEGLVQFLFIGELNLDNFDVLHLLEMMNLAQFMFLNNLYQDLEAHIEKNLTILVSTAKIAFEGLSMIYRFNLAKLKVQFLPLIPKFLDFGDIDNWKTDDPEGVVAFLHLTSNIMKEIMDVKEASQIVRFKAFVFWSNSAIVRSTASMEEQRMILESFDLDQFTSKELIGFVRKTGFYAHEDIDKRLTFIFNNYESEVRDLKVLVDLERSKFENLNNQVTNERSNLENEVRDLKVQVDLKGNLNLALLNQIGELRNQVANERSDYESQLGDLRNQVADERYNYQYAKDQTKYWKRKYFGYKRQGWFSGWNY